MNRTQLIDLIKAKKSFLCVGLDTDLAKIPPHLRDFEDPQFEFNRQIIDATKNHCIAYKPNLAFYEALGPKGWSSLEKTLAYIPKTHFTIADAKRGDIGNTAKMYARAFFETLEFDAVTVAPYMGRDSILPFLEFEDKWVILLALTSNKGAQDFQFNKDESGSYLFEHVLRRTMEWGSPDNLMFVVGATQASALQQIRVIAPDHFLLVPGVGSQGGNLNEVYLNGKNRDVGLLVNASRSIIYAGGQSEDFAAASRDACRAISLQMRELLSTNP